MPIVNILVTREGTSPGTHRTTKAQKAAIYHGIADLLHVVMGKPYDDTTVVFHEHEIDDLGQGGLPLSEYREKRAQTFRGVNAMNTAHVDAYFEALSHRDTLRIVPHLAESIVLLGPIFPEPTQGKDAVVEVLSAFLETIESLEVNLTFSKDRDVAVFFSFTCDGITVKGNEHLHLDENGLIDKIEVAWRPLPSAVLVQEVFANKLNFEAMRLVPVASL